MFYTPETTNKTRNVSAFNEVEKINMVLLVFKKKKNLVPGIIKCYHFKKKEKKIHNKDVCHSM